MLDSPNGPQQSEEDSAGNGRNDNPEHQSDQPTDQVQQTFANRHDTSTDPEGDSEHGAENSTGMTRDARPVDLLFLHQEAVRKPHQEAHKGKGQDQANQAKDRSDE